MELITSILKRPYVFLFLAAYLFLALRLWGWRRTLFWLITGYGIAWASEYSSIHNGFPYGEYHYIYENLQGELLVAGVPFFDSLSYPFLIFAGYTLTLFLVEGSRCAAPCQHRPERARGEQTGFLFSEKAKRFIMIILIGAFLTMFLDVIIDPIATMGDKWFLGQIHYYAYPGKYFGVPLSNFAGWFLVAFVVILTNELFWKFFPNFFAKKGEKNVNFLYPAFFISIVFFNILITFWVGEWKLGVVSSFWLSLLFLRARRAPPYAFDHQT